MAINRQIFLKLLETYGNNDFENIDYIVTTNSDIIRMDWYKTKDRGVQWVDDRVDVDTFMTGVKLYGPVPHSVQKGFSIDERTISFIEISSIDRISFRATTPPLWAWQPPEPE